MKSKYKLSLISILAFVLCSCATNSVGNHVNNTINEENNLIEIENNNSIEPREIIHVEENVVDRTRPIDATFSVTPMYGNTLNITVRNDSKANLRFLVYKNSSKVESSVIKAQKGKTVSFAIGQTATYRVVVEVADGSNSGKFTASIKARQFDQ